MVKTLFFIAFPFLFLKVIISQYSIIQAQHYEIRKYIIYKIENKIIYSVLCTMLFIWSLFSESILFYIILITAFLITNLFFANKQKLKLTKRIKRYLIIYLGLSITILRVNKKKENIIFL